MITLAVILILLVALISYNLGRATTYMQYFRQPDAFAEITSRYLWTNLIRSLKDDNSTAERRSTLRKGLKELAERYPHFLTPAIKDQYGYLFSDIGIKNDSKA